jgi:hypothetical protein
MLLPKELNLRNEIRYSPRTRRDIKIGRRRRTYTDLREKNNNNEVFSFDGGSVTGKTGPDANLTATKLYED